MDTHGEKSSEGHSPTPEPGTPDFVNVFTPDRVVKSPLDGNGCSNEKSTDTPGTVACMPVEKDSSLVNSSVFDEETEVAHDGEEFAAQNGVAKRRRRHFSNVIDNDSKSFDHRDTSPTPEPVIPDSANGFVPDHGFVETQLDVDEHSNQQSTDTRESVASMSVDMESDRYNMNHKNRGKCIVFNHETFGLKRSIRTGSSVDADRIQRTFQQLGFDVEILKDLKFEEIKKKIGELSAENHEDSDCICVFVLTHGEEDDMVCAYDVIYQSNEIWKPFTGDNCKTLAGKPKLFFFQACRGISMDSGVSLQLTSKRLMNIDGNNISYTIPIFADFLISHSTVTGYCSWRNSRKGTWFVQCLCDVLDLYADTKDLLKMLTITARKVASKNVSYGDEGPPQDIKKQAPSMTSMLLRDIYF